MAQIVNSAADFDGFQAIPASVLHPWLVLGEQATVDSELHALSRAIDALSWEWRAAWQYNQALWWLDSHNGDCIPQAMSAFQESGLDIRRASSSWGGAAAWLNEYGDPQKVDVYQPLYQHVLSQQQRLDQSLARLQEQVTLLCQEWSLPLVVVPDLSEGAADGRNA
jgi:hypothetical protein